MKNSKIKKAQVEKFIWSTLRRYIDFTILACCLIIALNIHPSNVAKNHSVSEKATMTYIFHDYEWNEYIMNGDIHGSSSSWDYLFDDEVPDSLKWDGMHNANSISIEEIKKDAQNRISDDEDSDTIKDNQVSIEDMMADLWININDWEDYDDYDDYENYNDYEDYEEDDEDYEKSEAPQKVKEKKSDNQPSESSANEKSYTVKESKSDDNNSVMVIEKSEKNNTDTNDDPNLLPAKAFTFVEEGWILPVLVPWNDLFFETTDQVVSYVDNEGVYIGWSETSKKSGITIIEDYADCMTPWWYKIQHWDSVLAYEQRSDAPNICNIERRFCWKWKLSWTYTQQWCSETKDYTHEKWWEVSIMKEGTDDSNWSTKQNPDWSVSVKNSQIGWSDILDRPNNTSSDFYNSDNIRDEDTEVDQTKRPQWDCTAPWGEKVKHWQFVQAFKHENWFSDSPCEAQIRLCSMWNLMWTYTESSCKTRDTSFIDWINGSPTRKTYSKEKLEWVRKQIQNEENYYKNARNDAERSINSSTLDRILYILDVD